MKLGTYLPSGPQVSREIIATVIGILGAAVIIHYFPALKKFVRDNSIN